MPTITVADSVWTLDLGDDENRFSPDLLESTTARLQELTDSSGPAVLVTSGTGKFFSNGLDLDWLGSHPGEFVAYLTNVQELLATILTLPVPTVAAVNGHAFGAGAMLTLAHDFRVMRTDRGYICFPEVDIGVQFAPGMAALVQSKLTPGATIEAMTTGRRYAAPDAHAKGLVDAVAEIDDLHATAAGLVRHLAGKDRATLAGIKATMFAGVLEALRSTGS